MKNTVLFFILVLFMSCCHKKTNVESNLTPLVGKADSIVKPIYTAKQLYNKLELFYKCGYSDSMKQLFTEWKDFIEPNSLDSIQRNDTIKEIFSIYEAFYMGFHQKSNYHYKRVVIQNEIDYVIVPDKVLEEISGWEIRNKSSIKDFRPPLHRDQVLYLTDNYAQAIGLFLEDNRMMRHKKDTLKYTLSEEETHKRADFLREYISIRHGHWGGYWHIETHPYVNFILLNETLTRARLEFREGDGGADYVMEKEKDQWVMKKRMGFWIE